MPPPQRGSCWLVQDKQLDENELKTLLQSNPSELQVAVLGSAGHSASRYRALPSLVLLRGKDAWVFDAGDDTQRQLGAMAHVRPSKVFRLFMTSLTSESVAGLPGLLCTIGQARVRGHETTDIPIHVYGPPGLANFLANIYMVSHTYLEVAIVVHELVSVAVPDQERQPEQINRRARIFTTQLPPDQLNPEGATDACLAAFKPTQGRAVTAKGSKAGGGVLAFDSRAAYLPFPDPQPGDPERAPPPHHQLRWTLQIDVGAQVVAVALPSPQPDSPRFAFVIQEADRSGALVVERAQALGIPPGRAYSELKEGRAVQNLVGQTIPPELCVSPKRPGRRVVIMSTCHSLPPRDAAFWDAAQDADLLVTGTVLPDELVLPRGLELSNDKMKSNISGAVMHNVSNSNGANRASSSSSSRSMESSWGVSGRGVGGAEQAGFERGMAAQVVQGLAASEVGELAAGLGTRKVLLTRFDTRLHGPDTPPAVDALIPTMLRQALRQAVATTAAAGAGRRADEHVAGFAAGEDFHVLVLDKNL
ncbi:beta-lactamase-like protein [Haematococcus lacustris]